MNEQVEAIRIGERPEPAYVNGVSINSSIYEFDINFLRESYDDTDKKVLRETVADIRMSPQLAKDLVSFLLSQIKIYEDQYGKVNSSTSKHGDGNV